MAFYYPRFQPVTHIADMGIAEIKDAVAILQGPEDTVVGYTPSKVDKTLFHEHKRWSTSGVRTNAKRETPEQRAARLKKRDKGLMLLERGIDILESLGGPCASNPAIPNMLRPLYAARFELLNGAEHLPRPDYAKHVHVQKLILNQSARLLFHNDNWEKSDVRQIDTTLTILGHFVKAFCALHMRPFNEGSSTATAAAPPGKSSVGGIKSSSSAAKGGAGPGSRRDLFDGSGWSIRIAGAGDDAGGEKVLTLAMVMDRIDEALRMAAAANKEHGASAPDLRWHEPKLLLLKSLLTIPLTGNLALAHKYAERAGQEVHRMKKRANPILDGLKDREFEMELGLYNLCLAELSGRMFDWILPPGQMEAAVLRAFEQAAEFFAAPFDTALDADGIMSATLAHERVFEIEAYCCCLLSYATFLLNAPRPKPTSTRDTHVFLPKQIFTLNPLLTVATASDVIYADVSEKISFPIEECRKRTGNALMRGLEINRAIMPEDKENPLAAWTLVGMACMYADTRDYLYATGLFESAHKSFVNNYGATSVESVLLQRLRYEFMAGVGSDQEAKSASHEIVSLLKAMDKLPAA